MLIRIRGGTPINSNHRFLREEAVSGKGGDEVHREIGNRTVSGMFNLSHVLEFVIDSLDNRPLPDQNLVCNAHERPFHVVPDFREQLNAINEQFLEEPLADVPLVPDELPGNVLQKGRVLEGFPVVHVAGGVIGNEKYIIFGKMEYIRISNNDTSFSVTMVHRFR